MREVISYELKYTHKFSLTRMRHLWRWRIVATNGKIIDSSTQGFVNKYNCNYNAKCSALSISKAFNGINKH